MKRKLLMTILTLTLALCSLLGLTACSGVEFKVNFVVDGAVYATIDTSGQEIIKMPENPSKENYTFDGWYWDKDTWQTPFTANSLLDAPLSSDMNVYAKWKANVVNVENISLNKTEITLHENDVEYLTATVLPSNATDTSVMWESSNSTIATVVGGKVTALRVGSATISAITNDGGKIATCNVYVEPVLVDSVALNYTSLSLLNGESKTLTATVLPNNATEKGVLWQSSNSSIVSVENGTITAVGYGTATITVKTSNNKTATCYVTVNPKTIEVTSISLNKTSATIEVGDTLSLSATISPSNATDKSVTWSSSNTSVATVSNGIVTAISEGTATITAKTSNNKTATCYITVNPQTIAVNSVSLNITNETIEVGDTLSLSATIYPSNATDKSVTWSSSDTSVATVSNGTVIAVSTGTVIITATTNNSLTVTCEITVVPKQILPTTIYLSKTSISLEEEEEINIVATILPTNATNKAIDWLVLDTSVAVVDNGKITAIAEGETMLIVTTANGLTATCSIIVTSPFVFELVGGSYALKSYNGTATEVVVPSSYKGKPVTAIGVPQEGLTPNATGFAYSTSVKKIVLPDTINTLTWGAFYQCQSLEEVNIPNDVKYIGFYLFYGCSSLKKLSVSLDYYETLKLYFAKTKYTNGTIEYLSIPSSLETVVVTGTKVGSSAFEGCSGLKEVIISDSVTSIGEYAFSGCSSLTSIEIPNSVTSIGFAAFNGCTQLTSVVIPNGVESIGSSAFNGCSSLTSVTIGDSVTSIGSYAFYDCRSLTSVTIGDSVTSIGDYAFYDCRSLTSVTIGDSVTSIGSSAFRNCFKLTSVVIPDSVTSIGNYAFSNCTSLTSIKYRGTESQWKAITKGTGWNTYTGNYTITYNYKGN